jgi:hypothetical protein
VGSLFTKSSPTCLLAIGNEDNVSDDSFDDDVILIDLLHEQKTRLKEQPKEIKALKVTKELNATFVAHYESFLKKY